MTKKRHRCSVFGPQLDSYGHFWQCEGGLRGGHFWKGEDKNCWGRGQNVVCCGKSFGCFAGLGVMVSNIPACVVKALSLWGLAFVPFLLRYIYI